MNPHKIGAHLQPPHFPEHSETQVQQQIIFQLIVMRKLCMVSIITQQCAMKYKQTMESSYSFRYKSIFYNLACISISTLTIESPRARTRPRFFGHFESVQKQLNFGMWALLYPKIIALSFFRWFAFRFREIKYAKKSQFSKRHQYF